LAIEILPSAPEGHPSAPEGHPSATEGDSLATEGHPSATEGDLLHVFLPSGSVPDLAYLLILGN